MMKLDDAILEIKNIDKPIRVIAEQSVDGVISCWLLNKLLAKLGKRFVVSFCGKKFLKNSLKEDYSYFILLFSDDLEGNEKKIFRFGLTNGEVNPGSFDGSFDIGGLQYLSEVVYLYCEKFFDFKEYAYILLANYCGCKLGDFGSRILKECAENKSITVHNCVNMFYNPTRELSKCLAYSFDPCLKSIYGDEARARAFLDKLRIDYDKKIIELDREETGRLVAEVTLDMVGVEEGDLYGEAYITKDGLDVFWIYFVIKTCLVYDKPGLALGFLHKNKRDITKSSELVDGHSSELIKAIKWVIENKASDGDYAAFNIEEEFREEIISELVKLLVKRRVFDTGILMIASYSLANEPVIYGKLPRSLINHFLEGLKSYGTYNFDGSGYFSGKIKDEKEFMEKAEFLFKNKALEEVIV